MTIRLSGRVPHRLATRPVDQREPDFDSLFDSDTLIYDVFVDDSGEFVVMTCPPFWNLLPAVERMKVSCADTGRPLEREIRHLLKHDQIWINTGATTQRLRLQSDLGEFNVEANPSGTAGFAGMNVLLTKSKDNDPVWICDWMRYHRDIHGANAVLLFDNDSRRYTPQELADTLRGVAGFKEIVVVSWPLSFGPQGDSQGQRWDSDFLQFGLMETARWRYLSQARAVLNSDVDELVVRHTRLSVFDAAARSPFGLVGFNGIWVPHLQSDRVTQPPRHMQFTAAERPRWVLKNHLLPVREWCFSKWAVAPHRIPKSRQWAIHNIRGYMPTRTPHFRFSFGHFRAITTSWRYDRSTVDVFEHRRHDTEHQLFKLMQQVDWDR